MAEEDWVPESRVGAPAVGGRAMPMLPDLVGQLADAPSGMSFIAGCLDRLVESWDLRGAHAVLNDSVLGLQLFNAGRRPFDLDPMPLSVIKRDRVAVEAFRTRDRQRRGGIEAAGEQDDGARNASIESGPR